MMVVSEEGFGFLAVFFGDIAEMGWPGQFNLDFLLMLLFGALWIAWRHRFSTTGLILAVLAFFGGAGFLLPYVLFLSFRSSTMVELVAGDNLPHGGPDQ